MLAAVTMVYNEPEFLPMWVEYYGNQVGLENCYIIDHGSEDGSVEPFRKDVNVIRIPREHKDNDVRTRFVTGICNSLLNYHSTVINTDVDEFYIPDPRKYKGLQDYCSKKRDVSAISAIGLNVTHLPDEESDIDLNQKVLQQRRYVRLVSPMCKPAIINKQTRYTSGFHGSNHPIVFDDLYMFHLRYFDLQLGLNRLERTRTMKWSSEKAGAHQRVEDETWKQWFEKFGKFNRRADLFTESSEKRLNAQLEEMKATATVNASGLTTVGRLTPNELFLIPTAFKTYF